MEKKIKCFRTLFCLRKGCQYSIHLYLSYCLKTVTVFNFYILWCFRLQLFQKHKGNYFTVADADFKIQQAEMKERISSGYAYVPLDISIKFLFGLGVAC